MNVSAEIAFRFKEVQSPEVIQLLEKSGLVVDDVILKDGVQIEWDSLKAEKADWRLGLESVAGDWQVSLSAIRRHELSLILLSGAEEKVESFCELSCALAGFVQARLYDEGYDRIQNLTNVNEYKKAGVDVANLQLVSNGLPFPLEEKVVDISKNPGRRELRDGFIEFVGHKMWFSNELVAKLSVDSDKLSSMCNVEPVGNGIRLTVNSAPFSQESQADIQNAVREVIYSANTPA